MPTSSTIPPSHAVGVADIARIPFWAARLSLPHWVAYRLEHRGPSGKATKVPVAPATGRLASSTNPADWGTCADACTAVRRYGLSGVGFVLANGGGLVAVDLDKCVDGGHVADWAQAIVDELGPTYTEESPSRTGLHLFIEGHLPAGIYGRRRGPVEVYASQRYLTVTGRPASCAGLPRSGPEQQAALTAWFTRLWPQEPAAVSGHDAKSWARCTVPPTDLRERAASGRIRRTTLALLDTTGPEGYGSPSEADAALAAGLVSAGLTAGEVYTLILGSTRGDDALKRKGQRHGENYWRRTVSHATALVGPVVAQPTGPRVRIMPRVPPRRVVCEGRHR